MSPTTTGGLCKVIPKGKVGSGQRNILRSAVATDPVVGGWFSRPQLSPMRNPPRRHLRWPSATSASLEGEMVAVGTPAQVERSAGWASSFALCVWAPGPYGYPDLLAPHAHQFHVKYCPAPRRLHLGNAEVLSRSEADSHSSHRWPIQLTIFRYTQVVDKAALSPLFFSIFIKNFL